MPLQAGLINDWSQGGMVREKGWKVVFAEGGDIKTVLKVKCPERRNDEKSVSNN